MKNKQKKGTSPLILMIVGLLLLLLFLPTRAAAQNSLADSWQVSYWNNVSLSGTPALVSSETTIDNNWGLGSPAAAINTDRFSARWEGALILPAGHYRFTATADDGVRVWINGRLMIDEWQLQPATAFTAEVTTIGGDVPVTVEYFENSGLAQMELVWQRLDDFAGRWQGEYFNNQSLEGIPALVRADTAVDFDWGSGSPAPDLIDPDTFSVRWTRRLDLPAGQYRFTLNVDDGARLWVNDNLLIDAWRVQGATTYAREVALQGGQTPVRLEYFENGGQAVAQLAWTRLHTLPTPGASTLVDNNAAGFVNGGPADDWQVENEGYNGSLLWSRSNASVSSEYNWARWYPALTPGTYAVEVYIPDRFSTTSQARYWISHADGTQLRIVDQSTNGAQWVALGTYYFEGKDSDFVSLADVSFETDGTKLVAFDAVRWRPVSAEAATTAIITPGAE